MPQSSNSTKALSAAIRTTNRVELHGSAWTLGLVLLWGLVGSGCTEDAGLHIGEGWIAVAPPNAHTLAGYVRLWNNSERAWSVSDIDSPFFERVEIHSTQVDPETGMARMLRQDRLDIAPNKQLVFQPGGFHLMLVGPSQPLRVDDTVQLDFSFADGSTRTVTFEIRPREAVQP